MNGRLPDRILKRPKQAYRAPIAPSFFASSKTNYAGELLSEKGLAETGLFKPEPVQKLLKKIKENQVVTEIDNMALAGILSTQLLYHQYISGKYPKPEISELKNVRTLNDQTTK